MAIPTRAQTPGPPSTHGPQATRHTPHCTCCSRRTARRRLGHLLALTALCVAGGIAGSLTTVWATHDFPDVPNTSPHHSDISWLADNGITTGFGDGTFKPTNPVARQHMASFLRRMNAEYEVVTTAGTIASAPTSWFDEASCPAGKRAVAGGGSLSGGNAAMSESYPTASGAWRVRWQTISGNLFGASYGVWALCAPGL